MDLLNIVLRTAKADEYISSFKKHGIEAFTLKLLSDNDLQLLGIADEDVRKNLLKHISTLQIPSEKIIQIEINEPYVRLILNQMVLQLHKQYANLLSAVKRDDIGLCNIKIQPSAECLKLCLNSLEIQLDSFEKQFMKEKNKSAKKTKILYPIVTLGAVIIFGCVYFKYFINK